MNSFHNKVAVVTGAGSGLGRSLATQLFQAGAHLALCDVNETGLAETRAQLANGTGKVTLHGVDVSDAAQMQEVAARVLAVHRRVELLINNAGISLTPLPFEQTPEEAFRKVINVNMWGVYNGIRGFLPHLRSQPEAGIINVSSLAGLIGLEGYSAYTMSKFAVRALSESLQMELAETPLHILVVFPGGIRTNIIKNAPNLTETQREAAHQAFTQSAGLTAEVAAQKILRAFQRKKKSLILGADARLVLTIRALFPHQSHAILHKVFGQMNFQ